MDQWLAKWYRALNLPEAVKKDKPDWQTQNRHGLVNLVF
jgi:hypothetical protein